MTTDIVIITELKEKLERAEYIRVQQVQMIQNYQEQIKALVKEKYRLQAEISNLNSEIGYIEDNARY